MSLGGDIPEGKALAAGMRRISQARTSRDRAIAFEELAASLAENGQGETFLSRVLARSDSNARRFALEIASRLQPLPLLLLPSLVGLLRKRKYPSRLRVRVAANILRQVPASSPTVAQVLNALERNSAGGRSTHLLARLAELAPDLDAIRQRRREWRHQGQSDCPRCGIRLPQAEFVTHLWQSHQLRFDGGRVREPWQLIEDWVNDYLRDPRGEVLDRCCELAQFLDPSGGVRRVHAILNAGGTPPEQHSTMRVLAAEQHASLCPFCYALVPFRGGTEPTPMLLAGGVLVGGDFRAEIRDRFMVNWLDADHGPLRLHHGPEPGHAVTRRGIVTLMILPMVALAAVFSVLPGLFGWPPMGPVAAFLFLACLSYFAIRMHWDHEEPVTDRVIDHAWRLLAWRFLKDPEVSQNDQLLLAGLANTSAGHGDADIREPLLTRCIARATEDRMADALVASLLALRHEDRETTDDEVMLLSARFGEACAGKISWGAANRFFVTTRGDLRDRTRRSRLRILMLAKAFQSKLEAGDLRQLGRLAPEVGVCYASEDQAGLARLRLLWLYRENRLWQRVGAAASVFDLAQYAQSYLEQRPDLLLLQPAPRAEEAPILICEEGIVYREGIIRGMDDRLLARPVAGPGGGYELVINTQRYPFRKNPVSLLNRLIAWRVFLFQDFLPRADLLANRHSATGDRLMNRHLRNCDACSRPFIGLPGETGLTDTRSDEEEE